jgi:glycosyltransferase involved in cell wall biosynthesis
LSLLALESMAMGTPVLGNEGSAVVKGQLERSRAGLTYTEGDAQTFIDGVQRLGLERSRFAANGKRFAARHQWASVVQAYLEEIAKLATS